MNTTLDKLHKHLQMLELKLKWAEYAYTKSKWTGVDLLVFQAEQLQELKQQIADTKYTIEQAELSRVNVSDLIGLPTQQKDGQLYVHFQNVAL